MANHVRIRTRWFLSGDTNIKYLQDKGVSIWDDWADENGHLGKVYGHQWRDFGGDVCDCPNNVYFEDCHHRYGIDQISEVIRQIKQNPNSRRLLVSSWNPVDLPNMALPPCHCLFQFYVVNGKLSCQLYQRSADIFLGIPFNIASYALLTMMVAQVCSLQVGEFIHTLGDAHLYSNHIEQAKLQLERDCRPLPTMTLNPDVTDIFKFKFEDFTLSGYDPHPHIAAPVAV